MRVENAIKSAPIAVDGDGTDKLDFTYIEDLMQGVEKIIKNDNSKNQIFNITHGNGRAINEIIEILKKNFKDLKIEFKQRDKLMPERGTLSIDKAKKLINYEPKWKIEDGYQKYIDWYKNFESKIKELLTKRDLAGLNITIPFKQKIMRHIIDFDQHAKKINAVNCVSIKKKTKGNSFSTINLFRLNF